MLWTYVGVMGFVTLLLNYCLPTSGVGLGLCSTTLALLVLSLLLATCSDPGVVQV